MASTGAILHFRPQFYGDSSGNRRTGASLLFSPRFVAGVFRTGVDNTTVPDALSNLPNARVPLGYVMVNGREQPVYIDVRVWYRFLQTLWETKLGGYAGSALPDVVTSVEATAASVSASATTTAAVAAQTQANAEALSTAVQVLQNAAIPGADQIPPVVTGLEAIP
jgi:hypothetical protein